MTSNGPLPKVLFRFKNLKNAREKEKFTSQNGITPVDHFVFFNLPSLYLGNPKIPVIRLTIYRKYEKQL